MVLKTVTAKEWEAMGLPTETSIIHFGNTGFVQKIREHHKKKNKEKKTLKKK